MRHTYFSLGDMFNPASWWRRLVHRPSHRQSIALNNHPLQLRWTRRAQRQLLLRPTALVIEMQLYFSCVVKKRVLFHEQSLHPDHVVNDKLRILFRCVQPTSCDPEEFARHYPEKRQLQSTAAQRMHPKELVFDFRDGHWQGEFRI